MELKIQYARYLRNVNKKNLLRGGCSHLGENGLLPCNQSLLARIKVVAQIDQAALVAYDLQNLSLPIHHVLVFQNLLDGHYFASILLLSLHEITRLARLNLDKTY